MLFRVNGTANKVRDSFFMLLRFLLLTSSRTLHDSSHEESVKCELRCCGTSMWTVVLVVGGRDVGRIFNLALTDLLNTAVRRSIILLLYCD